MTRELTQTEQVAYYERIARQAMYDSFHASECADWFRANGSPVNGDMYSRDACSLANQAANSYERARQARNGRNYRVVAAGDEADAYVPNFSR